MIPITAEVCRIEITIIGRRLQNVHSLLEHHRDRTFRHPASRGKVIVVIAPTTRLFGNRHSRGNHRSTMHVLLGSLETSILLDVRPPRITYDLERNRLRRVDLGRPQVADIHLVMIGLVNGRPQIARTFQPGRRPKAPRHQDVYTRINPQAGLRLPGAQDHEHNPRRSVRRAAAALIPPEVRRLRVVPQPRANASHLESLNDHGNLLFGLATALGGRLPAHRKRTARQITVLTSKEAHPKSKPLSGPPPLVGGQRHVLGGSYFEPAVLRDVSPEALLCREETFGPVIGLVPFHSNEEALEQLEVGMLAINTGALSTEVAPFGGVKLSGIGRLAGLE
jgi:Aldehyde dehydrogenase family